MIPCARTSRFQLVAGFQIPRPHKLNRHQQQVEAARLNTTNAAEGKILLVGYEAPEVIHALLRPRILKREGFL